jgi:hypothetical protein
VACGYAFRVNSAAIARARRRATARRKLNGGQIYGVAVTTCLRGLLKGPRTLLERILAASSDEGDVVLDPFCNCGTTIEAAERLKRNWLGIDVTHYAVTLIEERLKKLGVADDSYRVSGRPTVMREAACRESSQPRVIDASKGFCDHCGIERKPGCRVDCSESLQSSYSVSAPIFKTAKNVSLVSHTQREILPPAEWCDLLHLNCAGASGREEPIRLRLKPNPQERRAIPDPLMARNSRPPKKGARLNQWALRYHRRAPSRILGFSLRRLALGRGSPRALPTFWVCAPFEPVPCRQVDPHLFGP